MDVEGPPGHDVVISKGPCPKCHSKDNLVSFGDGHTHCFTPGCGHHESASHGSGTASTTSGGSRSSMPAFEPVRSADLLDPGKVADAWVGRKSRGLSADTCRKFGSFNTKYSGGKKAVVYPYYDKDGTLAAQKLRMVDGEKAFPVIKAYPGADLGTAQLYGRHVFGDRYDRRVVITEGEDDAMAVAQACDFAFAVVSIPTGASGAAKAIKANYLWLDRFAEIVLWFDSDKPGMDAVEEAASLFKVGKVKVVRGAPGFKDANAYLQHTPPLPGDLKAAVFGATGWRPQGIVNANDRKTDVMAPRERALFFNYPPSMPLLQAMTGGIYMAEVVYHVAGTGVGKSSQIREIVHHLLEQGCKVGLLSFEDTVRDAKLGLMSISADERLHLRPLPDPDDDAACAAYDREMVKWHDKVFGTGLVELFDPETAEWELDAILGYIRYLAKALGCKVIVIDPLSFVAAGIDITADERRVLDKVAAELAKMCKELNIHIMVSHHLKRTDGIPHEEGAPTSLNELRSSGGLANFAMCVVGWERNNQAADEDWRITRSRVLKPARRVGKSGLADVLLYQENGRTVVSPRPFPPAGKPSGDDGGDQPKQHKGGAFGPIDY